MYEFKLADLGEGMHEAEIIEWLIKEGDSARLDQTIAKVETDKAIVELPAPVAGRVKKIRVQHGQSAKVGDVLVDFEMDDAPAAPAAAAEANTPETVAAQAYSPPARSRPLAAPAVRKLAFELGVDLERVTPSSASGRISLEEVRAYAAQAASPPEPARVEQQERPSQAGDERQALTGLRKRIAEHMERSWRTIPHATAFDEVDGRALMDLRQSLKAAAQQRGARLTYMPLLVKLLVPLLKEFPIFNASLDEEKREIIFKRSYHIGIAAASPEGLLVPVLRDADHLTLLEIAGRLEKLLEGARSRTLALSELSGSTFTLNNVGSFGGSSGTPIINAPEAAILAVGRLQEKAVVEQGTIVARPVIPLALSFDHRLIDGELAARFLARFKELLTNPQQLLLDMH